MMKDLFELKLDWLKPNILNKSKKLIKEDMVS